MCHVWNHSIPIQQTPYKLCCVLVTVQFSISSRFNLLPSGEHSSSFYINRLPGKQLCWMWTNRFHERTKICQHNNRQNKWNKAHVHIYLIWNSPLTQIYRISKDIKPTRRDMCTQNIMPIMPLGFVVKSTITARITRHIFSWYKIVSRSSYFYDENRHTWKILLMFRQGPG